MKKICKPKDEDFGKETYWLAIGLNVMYIVKKIPEKCRPEPDLRAYK
jgi:hypothetical protein